MLSFKNLLFYVASIDFLHKSYTLQIKTIFLFPKIISVIQSLSRVHALQPHGLQHARLPCPSLSPRVCSNSCALSDAIKPSHPLLPSSPLAFYLSQRQGLFQEVHCLLRCQNYQSFGFSISPSNEYSGLISFRMDWLHLLAVQGPLKSLLQHHSLEESILSAFFIVQLTSIHDYWKNHGFDCCC